MPKFSWMSCAIVVLLFYLVATPLIDWLCRTFFKARAIHRGKRLPVRLDQVKAISLFLINVLQIATTVYLVTVVYGSKYCHLQPRAIVGMIEILRMIGEVFLILFFFDTNFYWFHRLAHLDKKLYRQLHKIHHVARYPNTWVTQYQHPLDYFFTTAAPMFLVALLPVPLSTTAYFVAIVVANFINIAGHSGYEVTGTVIGITTFNGWATYLDPSRKTIARWVNNALHHDLHHQTFTKNYSLYFTFWDRLCKTLHPDTDRVDIYVKQLSDEATKNTLLKNALGGDGVS